MNIVRRSTRSLVWLVAVSSLCGGAGFFTLDVIAASLRVENTVGAIAVHVSGASGAYRVESSTQFGAGADWSPFVVTTLNGDSQVWHDPDYLANTQRFFRFVPLDSPMDLGNLNNFRLTDQHGVSHELHYQEDEESVVIVFVGSDATQNLGLAKTATNLHEEFGEQGIVVWLMDSTGVNNRESLHQFADTEAIGLPILHDRLQLISMELGAVSPGEAVAINPEDESIFYRGALEVLGSGDQGGSAPLITALRAFLDGQPVTTPLFRPWAVSSSVAVPDTITYQQDVAPILIEHCVRCHSPGNIGPFAMREYAVIRNQAERIKNEVLAQRMPPWHADPDFGQFANDISLPPEQARVLVEWVNHGALPSEGDDPLQEHFAVQAPDQDYPFAWPTSLGEPDLILSIPEQSIPASGLLNYRNFVIPTGLNEDKWVRAAVILPGNPSVVHHCLTFDRPENAFLGGVDGYFGIYVPGTRPLAYPEGTGWLLKQDAQIRFQMHYEPNGFATTDETRFGLYFADQPPAAQVQIRGIYKLNIPIPPRTFDVEHRAERTLRKETLLYELTPHMHFRGMRFRYEALHQDGTIETLLNVPKYWFEWQRSYRFAEPKRLVAGTRIRCIAGWDNTHHNHDNPNPAASLNWGINSTDEMMIGYYQFVEVE